MRRRTVAYSLDTAESPACETHIQFEPGSPLGNPVLQDTVSLSRPDVRVLAARAPTRIDFGGGWTDVPPYSTEQGGCVCCVAIGRYATVELTEHPVADAPRPIEAGIATAALARARIDGVGLVLRNDYPVGAGRGGSSAAGVAAVGALAAWSGTPLSPAELAERSREIEVDDLGIAGGRQDHYAAAFGGALGLTFGNSTTAMRIPLSPATIDTLESECTIVYTGQSRISGQTITAVLDAYRRRDPVVTDALAHIRRLAESMIPALLGGAVDALGALVGEHWEYQRALHPGITTPRIDAIVERARARGAYGTKALGASGGGCVLVMAPREVTTVLRQELAELGVLLPMTVDHDGFRVLRAAETAD
jgi:D-glycero-alpha-D-manno-heptose-7-phosphate kinase